MNKYSLLMITTTLLLVFSFCGPSQQERERMQREEDSLMEIERNRALENVDAILRKMDSLSQDSSVAFEAVDE